MNLGYYPSQLTKLYEVMKQYDNDRKHLRETLYSKADELEKYKDSSSYPEEIKKILKEYDDALKPLAESTMQYIRYIEKNMINMVDNITLEPVTDEQMKLLQVAGLRESLTEDELDTLANSVKDNPVALGVVIEMAKKNGITRNYKELNPTLTRSDVMETIKHMSSSANEYVKTDVSNAVQQVNRFYNEHYGTPDKMENELTQRELRKKVIDFSTEGKFYDTMYGMGPVSVERFRDAIKD